VQQLRAATADRKRAFTPEELSQVK